MMTKSIYEKLKPKLAVNWHTRYTIKALKHGNYDTAIAIFCPSYKKEGVGFRREIGESTKKWIEFMRWLPVENKKLVYWDLCLENNDKLTLGDMNDLLACYQDFRRQSKGFHVTLLSTYEDFVRNIGRRGKKGHIPSDKLKGLMDRSRVFYGKMGWDDKRIKERLELLAGAYQEIGRWIEQQNAILIMTEHAYERGCLYGQIPIVYPDKKQL